MIEYIKFPEKRAFGVELEVRNKIITKSILSQTIKQIDKVHPVFVSGWNPTHETTRWHVKDDSSCGWEVASYKSIGINDLLNIASVADAIKKAGGVVDEKCGMHVHIDVSDFTDMQVATTIALWIKIEKTIANMLPSHRVKNKYCKFLTHYLAKSIKAFKLKPYSSYVFWLLVKPDLYGDYNKQRRVSLNVWNYVYETRKTLEFRMPEGTLDSNDIKNWVRLLLHFVNNCKNQEFPSSIDFVNVQQTLQLLGLSSYNKRCIILSKGMHDAKNWFLCRLLKYGQTKRIRNEAIKALNVMWAPIKTFQLLE
jgi:hypothetical protein